jgi:23S rRNA (uracil1939-C5)-methyltransferase
LTHDLVTLGVERPAVGGPMVARAGRRVVLVNGAIPGERVIARLDRVTRSVAFATTVRVEAASPDRRPAFDDPRCGGCIYSHIAYPRQLAIKSQVIADAFARIGRLELPGAVTVAASPERGYRMRARLHVRGRRIGFFREGTHEICDTRLTHQLLPETCDTLDRIAAAASSLGDTAREVELSENVPASERVAHIETSQPMDPRAVHGITSVQGLTAAPYVTDVLTIHGRPLKLRRHVLAFFQGNRYLLHDLVAHVAEQVPAGGSVLDLYAGTGVFSVAAAVLRDAHVYAVEGDRVAAEDLHANAAAAEKGIMTARANVEAYLAGSCDFRGRPGRPSRQPAVETVIVDPPRTGLSRDALDGVLRLRSPRIVYVSCDVATLARDSRVLVDGGYHIERADAFDLFPNTPHVETVIAFQGSAH